MGGTPHATSVRVQKTKARQEEITQEGCSRGRTGTPVFHIAFSQTPGCLLGSNCLRPPPNRLVEARSMMTGVEYRCSSLITARGMHPSSDVSHILQLTPLCRDAQLESLTSLLRLITQSDGSQGSRWYTVAVSMGQGSVPGCGLWFWRAGREQASNVGNTDPPARVDDTQIKASFLLFPEGFGGDGG